MVEVGVDLGRHLVRPALPHVVPEHRRVFVSTPPLRRGHSPRRIAAVTIRDEKAPETLSVQRVEDVAQHSGVGLQPQGRTTGVGREALRQSVREHRQHGHAQRLRRLDRQTLRDDVVGLEREKRVLLGRPDREDDAIIPRQVLLELHPVEVADAHSRILADYRIRTSPPRRSAHPRSERGGGRPRKGRRT